MECPSCNDSDIKLAEDIPVYIKSVDDYATKIKKLEDSNREQIETLQKELKLKDNYIKEIIKCIKKQFIQK